MHVVTEDLTRHIRASGRVAAAGVLAIAAPHSPVAKAAARLVEHDLPQAFAMPHHPGVQSAGVRSAGVVAQLPPARVLVDVEAAGKHGPSPGSFVDRVQMWAQLLVGLNGLAAVYPLFTGSTLMGPRSLGIRALEPEQARLYALLDDWVAEAAPTLRRRIRAELREAAGGLAVELAQRFPEATSSAVATEHDVLITDLPRQGTRGTRPSARARGRTAPAHSRPPQHRAPR